MVAHTKTDSYTLCQKHTYVVTNCISLTVGSLTDGNKVLMLRTTLAEAELLLAGALIPLVGGLRCYNSIGCVISRATSIRQLIIVK